MTTTANDMNLAQPARHARPTVVRGLQRFFRTPKGLMLLGLLLLTALAAAQAGFGRVVPVLSLTVAVAALVDAPLSRLTRGAWQAPTGALLSALFVVLILDWHEPWYVPVCTAVLAINSKYLFRSRWANLFNPAAIALVAAYFLFGSGQSWWGALPDLPLPFILVLLVVAVYISNRVNKVPMVLAFSGVYLGLFTALTFFRDPASVAEIFRVPNTNALIFFVGFMLTDPPTSPTRPRDQILYGVIVALASATLYLTIGAVYFLPAGLLVGNGWEAWRRFAVQRRLARARQERATAGAVISPPPPARVSRPMDVIQSDNPVLMPHIPAAQPEGAFASTALPAVSAPARPIGERTASAAPALAQRFARGELALLGLVLSLSTGLNFYGLNNEGYANQYYAAAVRSMSENWHAFFFNSFDSVGFVTVDKPPLGFWVQVASVKLLGYHGWSLLLPEALAGVLAVALLWWLVRRAFGPVAGLIAALALAVTPISVVTNRNNTIDSLLVLTLLGAAWAVTRAIESARHPLRWLLLGAVIVGLGFNIKMLEAYLALPALWFAYLLVARSRWLARVGHLALATAVMLAVSLSWAVAVDLTPASQRPYVGSSQTNSVLELALGYNGLQRLLGRGGFNAVQNGDLAGAFATTTGGQGAGPGGTGEVGEQGPLRLFNEQLGGQIGWTIPFALVGLLVAAWQVRPRHLRLRRTRAATGAIGLLRRRRAAVILWGMWFATMAGFFSIAGMFHRYYMSMLAPGIAALIGIGVVVLWREWSRQVQRTAADQRWLGWLLPSALVATALVETHLLVGYREWHQRLTTPIIALGVVATVGLVATRLLRQRGNLRARRLVTIPARGAVLVGLVSLLLAPTVWTGISVQAADSGIASNLPAAGPNGGGGMFGGFGGPPNGNNQRGNAGRTTTGPQNPFGNGAFPGNGAVPTNRGNQPNGVIPGNGTTQPNGAIPGFPGGRNQGNSQLVQWLIAHRGNAQYLVAVSSANEASSIIIETGLPVMATGGFSGSDPILTADSLAKLVQSGAIRYFMLGGMGGGFLGATVPTAQPGTATTVPPTGVGANGGRGTAGGQAPTAPDRNGSTQPGNRGTVPGVATSAPNGTANRGAAPNNPGNGRASVQSWVSQHCTVVTDSALGSQQLYDCGATH